jgi:hypothetical protein
MCICMRYANFQKFEIVPIETTSDKVQQPQHIDNHHSSQETSNDNQPPSREEISKEITTLAI